MINQSIPRSEDEESLHQDGRLQSVAVTTESLRLDVSSMQRNIKSHNGTINLLLERGVADRDERNVMVAKIAEQDVIIGDLESTIVGLKGTIVGLKGTIVGLKGTIVDLEGTIVNLRSDNDEERRYRACTEIVFGIRDINSVSVLENNTFVVSKGLSSTFKKLRSKRQDAAHLFLYDDLPETLLFKKDAFKRILDNSSCLAVDLEKKGITKDIIDVVLYELKKDLKDVSFATPIEAEVNDVDEFFRNTLKTLGMRGIQQLR